MNFIKCMKCGKRALNKQCKKCGHVLKNICEKCLKNCPKCGSLDFGDILPTHIPIDGDKKHDKKVEASTLGLSV